MNQKLKLFNLKKILLTIGVQYREIEKILLLVQFEPITSAGTNLKYFSFCKCVPFDYNIKVASAKTTPKRLLKWMQFCVNLIPLPFSHSIQNCKVILS